ncbi:MAG: sugar phosphate isomerase/epimerase family protein [Anaerolineae bacterium]
MINVVNIGIATDGLANSGQLRHLEEELAYYYEVGYRLVEINPSAFSLIVHGELRQAPLKNLLAVLGNFDLSYSVHGLDRLNLAYDPRHDLSRQIMLSYIEICRTIGATRLVYHSGLQALDVVRRGLRQTLLSDDELIEGARREVEAFKVLAPVAADAGVAICMENGDPHRWEFELLTRFNRPSSELAKHHPRLLIGPIVRQLEAINHPNVALTLDVAHLYISAQNLKFDYLEAASQAAPWVKHLHANDNFGHLDHGFDVAGDRLAFGEADIHLPPAWGTIPYHEIFARLPDYEGDLILEIKPGFRDYFGSSLTTMQGILDGLAGSASFHNPEQGEG